MRVYIVVHVPLISQLRASMLARRIILSNGKYNSLLEHRIHDSRRNLGVHYGLHE